MKTKSLKYLVLIVLVLAGSTYFFYFKQAKRTKAPDLNIEDQSNVQREDEKQNNTEEKIKQPEVKNTTKPEPQAETDLGPGIFSDGSEMDVPPPDILVVAVEHDGIKFSPNRISLKLGDIVIFKNKSLVDIHPVSEPKEAYPEFDSKEPIIPGGSWNFKFTKVGTWDYKDAANGAIRGVINVEK